MESSGIKHRTTTAYHPQVNCIVERFHRQLKVGLAMHTADWPLKLPLVLLGLRAAVKEDLAIFLSQLKFGTALRLPGEFSNPMCLNQSTNRLVEKLAERFDAVRALPPRQQGPQSFFIPILSCPKG